MNLFRRLFGKRAKEKSLDGIEESFSPTKKYFQIPALFFTKPSRIGSNKINEEVSQCPE
jgi:hypothetical protein